LFIRVEAEAVVSSRRVVIRLSSYWPHLEQFRQVYERLQNVDGGAVPPPG
jgi:hypothetical protein